MSEAVEQKAIELMDKVANGIDALSAKLALVAEKYGPDVVNAGLEVARFTAAQQVVYGVVTAVIGGAGIAYGLHFIPEGIRVGRVWSRPETSYREPDGSWQVVTGTFGLGIGTAASIFSAFHIIDVWAWVGIFEPKLWIAHKILGW